MFVLPISGSAVAAPSDLDPTFSGDGKVLTDFSADWDPANGVAIQADGKIVVAGTAAENTSAGDFAVARYNPDGALDPTFSGDGRLTTDFGLNDRGADVAIQADGKIVVVGHAAFSGGGFALARYNSDGSLDPTFSGDGRQTTGGIDSAYGVAIQPDGRIVVAGNGAGNFSGGDFVLARYNPDGSLDTSFSGDGIQTTDIGFSDTAYDVAVAADGTIVASGASVTGGGSYFAVARYAPDGSPDPSFPAYDQIHAPPFGGDSQANALAIQPDGKIVAAGYAFYTTQPDRDFALARYEADGDLDPTFAGDGTQVTETGNEMQAFDTAIQSDGRILVAGFLSVWPEPPDFAIARYEPNGLADAGFSADGIQTTDIGGAADEAFALATQPDGKIVAAGFSSGQFAVVRYMGEAPPDTTPPDTQIVSGPAEGSFDNDATPTFAFSSDDANAAFECRHDAGSWVPCSGPGPMHTPPALGDGIHSFEVRTTDWTGNVDASPASRRFAIDTRAPVTRIKAPITTTRDRTPTFAFSVSERDATCYCSVDGGHAQSCGSEFKTERLSVGRHTFRVTAMDRAGNRSTARDRFKVKKRRR